MGFYLLSTLPFSEDAKKIRPQTVRAKLFPSVYPQILKASTNLTILHLRQMFHSLRQNLDYVHTIQARFETA